MDFRLVLAKEDGLLAVRLHKEDIHENNKNKNDIAFWNFDSDNLFRYGFHIFSGFQ